MELANHESSMIGVNGISTRRRSETSDRPWESVLDGGENLVGIASDGAGSRQPDRRLPGLTFLPPVVCLFVLVILRGSNVGAEGRSWDSILFRCPCPQIRELTAFRAERPPRILFPRCRPATDGAGHAVSVASLRGLKKILRCEESRLVLRRGPWCGDLEEAA